MENGMNNFSGEKNHILPEDDPYNTIVLSGGGINGLTALGAIQYMYDCNKLQNVKTYYATSVGTIISYLLIIGYKPVEIMATVISEKLLDNFKKFNLLNFAHGKGGYQWTSIEDILLNLTLKKCEQPMTFADIYNRYGVPVSICAVKI